MTLTIDNKEYILDTDKAIKDGYLKPVIKRKIGQIYKAFLKLDNTEYLVMLVEVAPGSRDIGLVVLRCPYESHNGQRWSSKKVKVGNLQDITDDEWNSFIRDSPRKFELVAESFKEFIRE